MHPTAIPGGACERCVFSIGGLCRLNRRQRRALPPRRRLGVFSPARENRAFGLDSVYISLQLANEPEGFRDVRHATLCGYLAELVARLKASRAA